MICEEILYCILVDDLHSCLYLYLCSACTTYAKHICALSQFNLPKRLPQKCFWYSHSDSSRWCIYSQFYAGMLGVCDAAAATPAIRVKCTVHSRLADDLCEYRNVYSIGVCI